MQTAAQIFKSCVLNVLLLFDLFATWLERHHVIFPQVKDNAVAPSNVPSYMRVRVYMSNTLETGSVVCNCK